MLVSVVTDEPLSPGLCVEYIGDFARFPAAYMIELATSLGVVPRASGTAPHLMVFPDDMSAGIAVRMAAPRRAPRAMRQSDFCRELLALRQRVLPTLEPLPHFALRGQTICFVGTFRLSFDSIMGRLKVFDLTATRRLSGASALVVANLCIGQRANQLREKAEEAGIPVIEERHFFDHVTTLVEADRRWPALAAAFALGASPPSLLHAWSPSRVRYAVAI